MQIILKCRDRYGSVSFPAESLDGVFIPERQYQITNSTLILSGQPDFVLHRDCDTLLKMPDGLYRMPTPNEQSDFVQALQASVSVQETSIEPELIIAPDSVVIPELMQEPEEEQKPEEPANSPPALLDKIKKVAIGG